MFKRIGLQAQNITILEPTVSTNGFDACDQLMSINIFTLIMNKYIRKLGKL